MLTEEENYSRNLLSKDEISSNNYYELLTYDKEISNDKEETSDFSLDDSSGLISKFNDSTGEYSENSSTRGSFVNFLYNKFNKEL